MALEATLKRLQGIGEMALGPASLVSDSFRQRAVLDEVGHRPWPLPSEPWFMGQIWTTLVFAHWRVPLETLRRVVPSQLTLDAFEDSGWIGVTPFIVRGLRLRGATPVPPISTFPEINVRTYVSVDGKPGIYFFSLDADSRSAVAAARRSYRLPYFRSAISVDHRGDAVHYRSDRVSADGPPASFEATYRPTGPPGTAAPGSLAHWLTERYCLYTLDERLRIHRADIHHPPWPLQPAEATIERNTMTSPLGIALEGDPILHYSARQDVALWSISPVGG
jgi:uncharacterized protein YqjF (DUF2071 family)